MRILIVLILLFTSTNALSQPKKGLFEGIGAFLGVLGAKQLDINNPYALAAWGTFRSVCRWTYWFTY